MRDCRGCGGAREVAAPSPILSYRPLGAGPKGDLFCGNWGGSRVSATHTWASSPRCDLGPCTSEVLGHAQSSGGLALLSCAGEAG